MNEAVNISVVVKLAQKLGIGSQCSMLMLMHSMQRSKQ